MRDPAISIKIERPCEESWSDMAVDTQGRYCANCSKSVIDMTRMTDREIIDMISKNSKKICGRLSAQQSNRPLVRTNPHKLGRFYILFSSLFFFGEALSSTASSKADSAHIHIKDTLNTDRGESTEKKRCDQDSSKTVITGIVKDKKDNQPLKDVVIRIAGMTAGTTTDENGYFSLSLSSKTKILRDITLETNYLGYEPFTRTVSDTAKIHEISLKPDESNLIGEVMVIYPKKWWQFWKK